MTVPAPSPPASAVRERWMRHFPWITLSVVSLAVVASMAPDLIFVDNTPTGGDLGAHVFGPAYLRDILLPGGRIQGWSNGWYAGFPVFYFYFPLPALFIVAFDLFLPYGVAFKMMTVVGLAALAPSVYFLVRSMRFNRLVSTLAGAAGAMYVFMENPTPQIFGGTIASTLAGEFTYSWAFALSFVYLGCLMRAVYDRERRYFLWAGVALAATALCHLIPTLMVVFASLVVALTRVTRLRTVAGTWLFGFSLAAFWAVPLLARLGLSNDMNWSSLSGWDELLPPELWPMILMGMAGMAVALRLTIRALPLALLTLLPVGGYFALDQGAMLWNGRVLPQWFFGMFLFTGIAVGWALTLLLRRLPDRFRTIWFQAALVAAVWAAVFGASIGGEGIGGGGRWSWALQRISEADRVLLIAAVVAIALLAAPRTMPTGMTLSCVAAAALILPSFAGTVTGENYVNSWARWNYEGYEGKAEWGEYRDVMDTVGDLPPGRVQWEYSKEMNKYGTPMSLMLFPYWTEGTHPSMEGLFFESSITTPFHFLNSAEMSFKASNPIPGLTYYNYDLERGLPHMDLFNVSYYVAFTEEAKLQADGNPDLVRLAETEPFVIYRLPESSLVEPVIYQPWVYEVEDESAWESLGRVFRPRQTQFFQDMALRWYDDITFIDQLVVEDGPPEWQRVGFDLDGVRAPVRTEGEASDVVLEDHRIAFRTTAVGVPHLVKVSYFPNWRARGAEGPWRATPSLMVVIPTDEEVEITFERTSVEWAGGLLTLAGLAVAVALWIASRGRRARAGSSESPESAGAGGAGRIASQGAPENEHSPQDAGEAAEERGAGRA